jgi:hypothetical protein
MSKMIRSLLKRIDRAEKKLITLTRAVISHAEKDLRGTVSFNSKQDYDDNNYYSHITLSYIDGIFFDEYDVSTLEEDEVSLLFNKTKADPKNKVKGLLFLSNEELGKLPLEDRIVFYCMKKKITPAKFFSAFNSLVEIKYLKLPEDKVEFS